MADDSQTVKDTQHETVIWSSTWLTHGRCAVCDKPFRLLKDGTVHVHGPRNRRCPGSWGDPQPGIVVSDTARQA